MPVDYKYSLFNIRNDKLSIFCILTHRYGKHRKSQSMKDLWTLVYNLPLIHSPVIN